MSEDVTCISHEIRFECAVAYGGMRPDLLIVRAVTLSQDTWRKPVADIWTINARPEIGMNAHNPKVYRSPSLLEENSDRV